jgi:hypothetical protein
MKKILVIIISMVLLTTLFGTLPALADDTNNADQTRIIVPPHPPINPEDLKNVPLAQPVPETEMVHIKLNKEWIYKNDMDPEPFSVWITFPTAWIETGVADSYDATKGDTVELNVWKQLLIWDNESKDKNNITVRFPTDFFNGLPQWTLQPQEQKPLAAKMKTSPRTPALSLAPEDPLYLERILYLPTSGVNICGSKGHILPLTFNNPQGETLCAFHEIEFYGNTSGDVFELVSCMHNSYGSPRLFWGVYTNGGPSTQYCFISVPTGTAAYYEIRSDSVAGKTNLLLVANGITYMASVYDSTTPSNYVNYKGSSELWSYGGITYPFSTYTYGASIESLYTTSWSAASYVDTRLDFYSADPDQSYVGIYSDINSSRLLFNLWAIKY